MEKSGQIELNRIINCMKDYEYDDNSLKQGEFDGSYIFNLNKRLDYSRDDTIKVTIDFSTDFDNENKYEKDDNDNFLYNDENNEKAHNFINKLMKDDLTKKGGQKGGQKRKTKKETKRNKKKQKETKRNKKKQKKQIKTRKNK
jgi:hypothetical protein